jgi:pyrroloquinoline-quinone synthase
MKGDDHRTPLSTEAFVNWLTREGSRRYHDHHPFHQLMHDGTLTKRQLQQWVLNRYYYQTRIPMKDALIVSKSEDPNFRRMWLRRIQDQDGQLEGQGGLASWLKLARGVGLDVEEVRGCQSVLPGVRLACDGYVQYVREASLLEAVACSLTELFAPALMGERLEAWKQHYPWVGSEALEYFQRRISQASLDSNEGIQYVVGHATTSELQERCVRALIKKTGILWHILDCLYMAYVEPREEQWAQHDFRRQSAAQS